MNSLYGLIGEKLSHSISPMIHSIIFKKLSIDAYYHLFETKKEDLGKIIEGLALLGARGINVTIPYKTEVFNYIDGISQEAKRIGSVNTLEFTSEGILGHNTDYFGLKQTFEKYNIPIKGERALLLGSGGVAITVVQLLKDMGIKDIDLIVRDKDKMQNTEIFKDLAIYQYEDISKLKHNSLLVNCTPSGMYPHINECAVSKEELKNLDAVVDLIYNPKETLMLKYAKELGLKGVNGLYMLVGQAVEAQRIWNKLQLDLNFVDEVFQEVEENCGWL